MMTSTQDRLESMDRHPKHQIIKNQTERFGTALVIVLKFAHRSHRIHTVVSLRMFKSSVPQLFAFLRLS